MKNLLTKNKKLNFAIRTLAIYVIFFILAKYVESIYIMGILSNTVLSILVVVITWLYRLLSYTIIPATLFLLLVELLSKKIDAKNTIKKTR